MVEEISVVEHDDAPQSVGQQLRAAREAAGLDFVHVSAQTRISQRHLQLIEQGRFDQLPGRTYAVGFSRSYAQALGLDGDMIARLVREELTGLDLDAGRQVRTFEPGDPARVPSARLAWISAAGALLLFAGGSVWLWQHYVSPSFSLPSLLGPSDDRPADPASGPDAAPPPPAVPAQPSGAVVFTALEPAIWVKFYDAAGKQLMQKQMAQNESWTVPADAIGPMVWTGRPDALAISIGGTPMGRLGDARGSVKDVSVTADGLVARIKAASAVQPVVDSPVLPAGAAAPGSVRRTPRPVPVVDYTPQQTAGDLRGPVPASSPTAVATLPAPDPGP